MIKIIRLPVEDLIGLHFYKKNLCFPVVIASYSSWEETQIQYLNSLSSEMTVLDLCKWCINHNIRYQILYPINKKDLFKNPIRFFNFLSLKRKIRCFNIKSR